MKLTVLAVAALCHEVNRVYCQSLSDYSQPDWHAAPTWQKESAIAGVRHSLEHPGAHPRESHTSWLDVKLKDGWRYGPVKDPMKKEHPCIKPFEELPPQQQAKDHLFCGVVETLRGLGMIDTTGEGAQP